MKPTSPPGELLAMVPRVRALRTTVGHAKRAAKKAWSPGLSPSCALASSSRSPSARPRPRSRSPGNRTLPHGFGDRAEPQLVATYGSLAQPDLTTKLALSGLPTRGIAIARLRSGLSKGTPGRDRTCNLPVRSRALVSIELRGRKQKRRVRESNPCYPRERRVS